MSLEACSAIRSVRRSIGRIERDQYLAEITRRICPMEKPRYRYREANDAQLKAMIAKHESFILEVVNKSDLMQACAKMEDLIEAQSLSCRIYTEYRGAAVMFQRGFWCSFFCMTSRPIIRITRSGGMLSAIRSRSRTKNKSKYSLKYKKLFGAPTMRMSAL